MSQKDRPVGQSETRCYVVWLVFGKVNRSLILEERIVIGDLSFMYIFPPLWNALKIVKIFTFRFSFL